MVKYLTVSSYLTGVVRSRCARMLQDFLSPYIDFRKIGAIRPSREANPARAVWISQRLRWRRHSAEGSRACLQAWEGACRRTRALFHV